jgi:catechol 2,3-dioxygenase-like lactoylglutathione lyase family enzyme
VWFERDDLKVHLGVEKDFRAARKAHPALLVEGLAGLLDRLRSAQVEIITAEPLTGYERAFVNDPFGNRIELLERVR